MLASLTHHSWLEDNSLALFSSPKLATLILLGVALATWRFWTFSVAPKLHPNKPKTLPYWVPLVGHLFSFFSDANRTITQARLHFGNTREPFALNLGGQTMYIITSAKDTAAVLKNVHHLTFDDYIKDMQSRFGASKHALWAMWTKPSDMGTQKEDRPDAFPNPSNKALTNLCEAIFKIQLHPGKELEILQASFLGTIHERMRWDPENFPDFVLADQCSQSKPQERIISLKKWTQHALMEGATRSFFGKRLLEIEPDLFDSFFQFDDNSWKMTYRIPAPFAREMLTAKHKAQMAFERYFDLPLEERSDACYMVRTLESEMRAVGIGSRDIAAFLLMMYWVINGNAWKVSFWLLSFVLHRPELLRSLQAEIAPHLHDLSAIPLSPNEFVKRLENSPLLVASFHETLRLTTSSITVRSVVGDCLIGNVTLEKGAQLIIPFRQMLLDEQVFGHDATEFNPDRFIQLPQLAKSQSFRPFGGGITYCPGRFMAQKEILTLSALLIGKFQAEMHEKNAPFPIMEQKKPCLGVMGPKDGHDLLVHVKERSE